MPSGQNMVMVNLMFLLSYKPTRRRTTDLKARAHPQQGQDDLEEAQHQRNLEHPRPIIFIA